MIKEFLNQKHHDKDKELIPYLGIDATTDSLHIGHLIPIRQLLRYKQKYVLVGTSTAQIGDPTGKTKEREQLQFSLVTENANKLKEQILAIIPDVVFVENAAINDFVNLSGFVSVNKLSKYEVNKSRIEAGLPLTLREFIYPVLQANDFLHLHKTYGVNLQIGGSDQYCNILTGIDLIKNITKNAVFGITTHLLTSKKNQKLGKTTGGLKLTDNKKDIWDFFRSVKDTDLRLFYPQEDFNTIEKINLWKCKLADEMLDLIKNIKEDL